MRGKIRDQVHGGWITARLPLSLARFERCLSVLCWIKEQSRPTHSHSLARSQQHLLKTGRKQPLKECCRCHTLLSAKRSGCLAWSWYFPTRSLSLCVLGSWRKASRSRAKGDILVSAAALRAENCAKRIVCIYCIRSRSTLSA
jgi:hypothetical protein